MKFPHFSDIVSIFRRKRQPEDSRQPQIFQEAEDARAAVAKILEMSDCHDLRISSCRRVYAMQRGSSKKEFLFYKHSSGSFETFETLVMFKTGGEDMSWKDLHPRDLVRLVSESLPCCFFSVPDKQDEIAVIPAASSAAELNLKLDMLESIFITYPDLVHSEGCPNWIERELT